MNPLPEAEPVKRKNLSTCLLRAAVGSVFVFNSIFYDYNSSSLKEDAIADLNTIYDAMTVRPEMKIQLSAHTDARAMHFTINNYQNKGQRLPKNTL